VIHVGFYPDGSSNVRIPGAAEASSREGYQSQ
jgi:hypothetical protein